MQKMVNEAWVSLGTFYSPVCILTLLLHTYMMTTVDAALSHVCAASLTEKFVCVTVNISDVLGR